MAMPGQETTRTAATDMGQAPPVPDVSDIEAELRARILERLNLGHVDPEGVRSDTPLFRGGLELDSLDALEITVLVEEDYGIVIGVAERNESVFGTLGDLARFVRENYRRDIDKL